MEIEKKKQENWETGMNEKEVKISVERIEHRIYLIRGQKVMLDHDLADLYGVPTKALKQAVRRNIDRFPSDFMFELTPQEFVNLRSQIVTSSLPQWGGARYKPMSTLFEYGQDLDMKKKEIWQKAIIMERQLIHRRL